jgi:GNAT superfamily N-acetyltransferase
VELRAVRAGGLEYLGLVTELLQRQRVTDATAGLWEAADLQWWYTRDPHPSEEDAVFWVDGGGAPVVAAVFTRWSPTRYGCDVLGDGSRGPAWAYVRKRCAGLGRASVEMGVAPDDEVTAREAERAGFTDVGEHYEIDWLAATDRPGGRELPDGYTLLARPEQTGPHPMIKRNGDAVEARLQQCSLYDPELDLAVTAPDGQIAAYAMFWADRRTGIGLVEPMRVEDEHSGLGVAAGLLRAGLGGLAERGCRELKVGHDRDNEPARRLYHGAGFRARTEVSTLVRPATE